METGVAFHIKKGQSMLEDIQDVDHNVQGHQTVQSGHGPT